MYLYVKTWRKHAISIRSLRKVIDIHTQMFETIISECFYGWENVTVAVKAFILSDISQRVSVISVKAQ